MVASPTHPLELTTSSVSEEEPIAKIGAPVGSTLALTESCAHGVEVPRPKSPLLRSNARVEVENTPPELVEEDTEKRVGLVEEAFASKVSVANGEEVPKPKFPVVPTNVN